MSAFHGLPVDGDEEDEEDKFVRVNSTPFELARADRYLLIFHNNK